MSNYIDIPVPRVPPPGNEYGYEPLTWAKQNCPSYITNDAVQRNGVFYYRFYFGNEKDQIWFAMRWVS